MDSALSFDKCSPNHMKVETYRARTKHDERTDEGVPDYDTDEG